MIKTIIQNGPKEMYRLAAILRYICALRCMLISSSQTHHISACHCQVTDPHCVPCVLQEVYAYMKQVVNWILEKIQFCQVRISSAHFVYYQELSGYDREVIFHANLAYYRVVALEAEIYCAVANALASNSTCFELITLLATCPQVVMLVRLLQVGVRSAILHSTSTGMVGEIQFNVEI